VRNRGREWLAEEEFYKLEATVSAATLDPPCVAICTFDLRTQPARNDYEGAFEGYPVTVPRDLTYGRITLMVR
jgi:hypothetical protein